MENLTIISVGLHVKSSKKYIKVEVRADIKEKATMSRNGGVRLHLAYKDRWVSKDKFNSYEFVSIGKNEYMFFTGDYDEYKIKSVWLELMKSRVLDTIQNLRESLEIYNSLEVNENN